MGIVWIEKKMNETDKTDLDFWEWLLLWEQSESYLNYRLVPFVSSDFTYGIQVYTPNGLNQKQVWGLGSVEEAIAVGRQIVEQSVNRIQRESLLTQLSDQGLLSDGAFRHALRSLKD